MKLKEDDSKKRQNVNTPWYNVGVIKGTSYTVSNFLLLNDDDNEEEEETSFLDIDPTLSKKLNLEPGTAYKFRVAAVNSCGRGPWSEVFCNCNFEILYNLIIFFY